MQGLAPYWFEVEASAYIEPSGRTHVRFEIVDLGDDDGTRVRVINRAGSRPVPLRGLQRGEQDLAPQLALDATIRVRGLKGAVGTQLDQLTLLGGDADKVDQLEARIVKHLGFKASLGAVGQVYPRSLDFDVVSALFQVGAAAASCATTLRLMAGAGLLTEGFQAGQVGSSAMPHKMNTRSCERVNGLQVVLRGYASMAAELAGAQWNEGDVFCSVVRRVALPDAFFAIDGQTETFLTVLDEFGAYPAVIQRELDRYLPFLATTRILMAAVRAGVGRETAHEVIKEHAVAVALAMREKGQEPDLLDRLAADPRLPLDRVALEDALADKQAFSGAAGDQVDRVAEAVDELVSRYPEAAKYTSGAIL